MKSFPYIALYTSIVLGLFLLFAGLFTYNIVPLGIGLAILFGCHLFYKKMEL